MATKATKVGTVMMGMTQGLQMFMEIQRALQSGEITPEEAARRWDETADRAKITNSIADQALEKGGYDFGL